MKRDNWRRKPDVRERPIDQFDRETNFKEARLIAYFTLKQSTESKINDKTP